MEEKKWDMKIRSITKIDRVKEDTELTQYRLVARDSDGVNQITIVSGSPFEGMNPKDGIIQINVTQSQKTLNDFKN